VKTYELWVYQHDPLPDANPVTKLTGLTLEKARERLALHSLQRGVHGRIDLRDSTGLLHQQRSY
jgi:hypothetical protein